MKDIKTAEEVKNAIESILISETLSIKIKTNTLVSLFNSQLKAKVNAISDEEMAEYLHNNYEEIALNNGWKTQEQCQVPFNELPKENKQTMTEVCSRLKTKLLNDL